MLVSICFHALVIVIQWLLQFKKYDPLPKHCVGRTGGHWYWKFMQPVWYLEYFQEWCPWLSEVGWVRWFCLTIFKLTVHFKVIIYISDSMMMTILHFSLSFVYLCIFVIPLTVSFYSFKTFSLIFMLWMLIRNIMGLFTELVLLWYHKDTDYTFIWICVVNFPSSVDSRYVMMEIPSRIVLTQLHTAMGNGILIAVLQSEHLLST